MTVLQILATFPTERGSSLVHARIVQGSPTVGMLLDNVDTGGTSKIVGCGACPPSIASSRERTQLFSLVAVAGADSFQEGQELVEHASPHG